MGALGHVADGCLYDSVVGLILQRSSGAQVRFRRRFLEKLQAVKAPKQSKSPAYLVNAVRKPIQDFIHTQQIGAIILLLGAVAALGWVNSPWAHTYEDFWHTHVAFDIHIFAISEDLKHLVNDGLMAVFFFLVGLEIRRELRDGELSTFRKAALPAFAAVGGMVVPAAVYLLFNASGEGAVGWGIPMATDIAFALGVLALVGKHIPAELRVFLLGLAVVDDLGAIAVIATFYTETIDWVHLGLAVGMFVVIWGFIRLGIRSLGFYIILCVLMWQFLLESGIHATLAGVAVAAIVPCEPDLQRKDYRKAVEPLLHDFELALERGDMEKAQSITEQIEKLSRGTEGPLVRLEHKVHPWVSFVILPLFALANAGIVFTSDTLSEAVNSDVAIGVVSGLLVGKVFGIFGFSWLAVRLGLGQLPSTVRWGHVLGIALLAGIGFTVAIFVSGIAFDDRALIDQSKMGIFGASLVAGVVGYLFLRFVSPRLSQQRA